MYSDISSGTSPNRSIRWEEVELGMTENVKVSIGIPVYNGEPYLPQALDSLLGQTFADFEIIISDNASEDGTEELCRQYAAQDSRIRYVRNETNLGAAKNYNGLVTMARGEYFKWAAHDDWVAPTYLERCLEVLEKDPSYVLAYTLSVNVDDDGTPFEQHNSISGLDAPTPHARFKAHTAQRGVHQNMVFGVMRTISLRQTGLIGAYASSDRVLNAELTLYGRFYEVPEVLFYKRVHSNAHWRVHKSRESRNEWYDPQLAGKKTYPMWRLMQEHFRSIGRAPIGARERELCYLTMLRWLRYNWRGFVYS